MSSEFWLGVIVTTLIGILLIPIQVWATPRIQEWFEKNAISARTQSLSRLKREYAQAKYFHENLPRYHVILFIEVLFGLGFIIILGVVILVVLVLFWMGLSFSAMPQILQVLGVVVFAILVLSPFYVMVNLFRFIDRANRVAFFDKYEKNALARIAELESRKPGDKAA